jgi:hypothetical protein
MNTNTKTAEIQTPTESGTGQSEEQNSNHSRRRHNKGNDKNGSKNKFSGLAKKGFIGNTEDMNNHVFQCHNETQDRQHFEKTVDALFEYINKVLIVSILTVLVPLVTEV